MQDVTISAMGARGEGVANSADGPVAVPFTLPGERVRIGSMDGGRAVPEAVVEASPERIEPFCSHFGQCGGCSLQHWAAEPYRAWKRRRVVEALARAGIEAEIRPLVDASGEGRRRVMLHLRMEEGAAGVAAGFMAARSHRLIEIDHCPILVPALEKAAEIGRAIARRLKGVAKTADLQLTATETGIDADLRGTGKLPEEALRGLLSLAGVLGLARLTLHGVLVVERQRPVLTIGKARLSPPPGGFLQATAAGEEALARLVADALPQRAKAIADLFCGVGPFALRLAERARILAADSEAAALAALSEALRHASGLKPLTVLRRDLFRTPLSAKELAGFDAAIFDPPRAGAQAQARALADSTIPVVIGVSCNPDSFARDATILIAGGYRLEQVTPVDQFVHSAHVELVARFSRIQTARGR
jgi:23S rRNA (uracil1939-C5)-methyltransferase